MPQNSHLEIVNAEEERLAESSKEISTDVAAIRAHATTLANKLPWLPDHSSSETYSERCRSLSSSLRPLLSVLHGPAPKDPPDEFRWLHDNVRLIDTELQNAADSFKSVKKTPHVRMADGSITPRTIAIAEGFLEAANYQFSDLALSTYLEAFQKVTVLNMKELWAIVPSLKLVLLEQIAVRGKQLLEKPQENFAIGYCVRSLRDIGQTSWKEVLEPQVLFDRILRQDPVEAYAKMDYESREFYRTALVKVGEHSDFTEMEVASAALSLARESKQELISDARLAARKAHVGHYIVGNGLPLLKQRVGFKAPLGERITSFLKQHPDEYFLPGIELLTLAILLAIVLPIIGPYGSLGLIILAAVVVLLPSSQSAVQLMNYLTTSILKPQIIPKLDYSEGIPNECLTLVAIPTLLLNTQQVHRMVENLEVRYLGNHDPNIHFALVTDLPDAREHPQEDDPLVDLCGSLIDELNEKYAADKAGSFLLLHRHRVYNPRERVWMGWERKRGKLLDLNKLLRQQYDSFPVKVGDLSILPKVRFVITLDSDTELPRGSAHRMIGAMAHPLNQAIIDREKNVVIGGYGILQPRVGVSVQSASKSRMAAIYSGETGFDIYSRAVSDVYQDLYGEGIFTGKGIYEVDTVHQVLDRRFPRNALLSHDLIEGAYARAGLVSDIEIIEDYPSHYSAYNRRKHRWLRGDWQIAGWLLSVVPDESGKRVRNPISIVSQWKIVDNLRRSLVEPATFLLLLLGWTVLPGSPLYWTLATLAILFVPAYFQFVFTLVRAGVEKKSVVARDAVSALVASNVNLFFTLTFLAHQMLVSLDAMVRVLVRRTLTRQRMLEWETAAEAELGVQTRTPIDTYLDWMPALVLGLGLLVYVARRGALASALPILVLWGSSKLVSKWLNRPSRDQRDEFSENDEFFLRKAALRIWRYYAEFSTNEHNWLIPDNLQQEPYCVAGRVSPTNLGFLLNARQVACEFGYLTVPELAEQTSRTLDTILRMKLYRGHLLNWYDTRTLEPLPPAFVSSVDSGNLLASLWTLEQGCLERLRQPVTDAWLAEGLLDHLKVLVELKAFSRKRCSAFAKQIKNGNWLKPLIELSDTALEEVSPRSNEGNASADLKWFRDETKKRLATARQTIRSYNPWLLPEFDSLKNDPVLKLEPALDSLALQMLPNFIEKLSARLEAALNPSTPESYRALLSLLPEAKANAIRLIQEFKTIAAKAEKLADEMDFAFLLNGRRKMMSVGFDVAAQELNLACYDLLATESRTAVFVAIAKEDVPQESWFTLGRAHTLDQGRPVLLSWTGTMFEYLMPALWMRTFPNTLIQRSLNAAVHLQQTYTEGKRIPWGISESAHSARDEAGNYQYYAFGVPQLALRKHDLNSLVISPYSTFLALMIDPVGALRNLRRMMHYGWFGEYGFYESVDFSPAKPRSWRDRYEIVRCWMAHHQGMSLLSIANFLRDDVVQRWFHADRRVQASELLLHERPVAHVRRPRGAFGRSAA